jgi:hypothetical protein
MDSGSCAGPFYYMTDYCTTIRILELHPQPGTGLALVASGPAARITFTIPATHMQKNTKLGEQNTKRRIDGRPQVLMKERSKVETTDPSCQALEISVSQAAAVVTAKFMPQRLHHSVQRVATTGAQADFQIQRQRYE